MITDKTDRLQKLYQQMIREIQDYAISLVDTDGTVLSWNKGAERIVGYAEGEIVGHHFRVFYMPQDQEAGLPEHLLEHAAREGRAKHVGRRLRRDGSTFWGSVILTALHDDDGSVIGFAKLTRELRENELD